MNKNFIKRYFYKLLVSKTFRSQLLYILVHIHALFFVLIIRLLSPFVLIRIGEIHSHRMGHFAANSELYLCEKRHFINVPDIRYFDIFYINSKVCNQEFLKIIKQSFLIIPRLLLQPVDIINKLIPGGSRHYVGQNMQHDRDIGNLLDITPIQLTMSIDQEIAAKQILNNYGISSERKFICLIVRDSAYLSSQFPDSNFDYHDYRDSDIDDFIPALESITQAGLLVFRMGVIVKKKLETNNSLIIDYATNGMRCDLLDIYLAAKCEFCISTSTGFDALPVIFRRPIVFVNQAPLGYFISYRTNVIGIFKHYYSESLMRNLNLWEIFETGSAYFLDSNLFSLKGINLQSNTPKEIDDVICEFMARLSNDWVESDADSLLQKQFWEKFSEYDSKFSKGMKLHGELVSRIGTKFLQENPHLLV